MFPFDVILFDIGGVLLTNGWDHCERAAVLEQFHLDKAEFERRHPGPNDLWERDMISAWQYLDETVFYEPRSFSHEDFLGAIFAQSVELPNGALGILRELAASGRYMVGCLNNEAREPNEYRFEAFGLRQHFDVALSSCFVGLRKPKPEMYRRAVDILGKRPDRILFIDDRAENAASAAAAGMKSIWFKGADSLRRDLEYLAVF
ncbi:MAG TPA: HAD-IA family hydrolase [Terracidiphilus sp.]|jgi:putative hydrolase of the HAD superfamily